MTFLGHGGEVFPFNTLTCFSSVASHTACAFLEIVIFLSVLHFGFLYFCHFMMKGCMISNVMLHTIIIIHVFCKTVLYWTKAVTDVGIFGITVCHVVYSSFREKSQQSLKPCFKEMWRKKEHTKTYASMKFILELNPWIFWNALFNKCTLCVCNVSGCKKPGRWFALRLIFCVEAEMATYRVHDTFPSVSP